MFQEKTRERIPRFLKNIYRFIIIIFRYPLAHFRALPDFIIIGVQKGGTSTLFEYLKQHPDIKTSVFKEVHYYDINYSKGKNWYKSYFPLSRKNKQILYGEATPYYFFHPLVPERVFKDNPNIKLILLLRDPVERAYSHYQMERRKGREKIKSFEEAISIEAERIKESNEPIVAQKESYNYNHQVYGYLARGCYDEQLRRWLKYFKREQLLVLKSEDFFSSPKKNLEKIYQFLNIPAIFPKNLQIKNQGGYTPLNSDIIKRLRLYYHKHNKQLCEFLGEQFQWN